MAYLSPRLGILNNIPFAIPFDVRVAIFRHFIVNDIASRETVTTAAPLSISNDPLVALNALHHGSHRTQVTVRRGKVAEDGFDRLADVDLKLPVEISFIDQFGVPE